MRERKTQRLVHGAAIAALYTVLTVLAGQFGLASGVIQLRLSEALTILPFFTPAAVPGLSVGCFVSNLITGCPLMDTVCGTFATLIGALGTRALKNNRWLAPVPPVLSNMLILPFVFRYAYGMENSYMFMMLSVGVSEILSCYVLGEILLGALKPSAERIFRE